ncbi:hypothetical protein J1605_006948 [Eschrichtius robustus]|uniref:Uncharacterized protein n=1 Tax=Eschrichtius robustus TaxID=9764 RepID=A0AB34H0Z4_ESCRO|nr:hypothetical protein J1605_006948 [Eschrichtius robustus]
MKCHPFPGARGGGLRAGGGTRRRRLCCEPPGRRRQQRAGRIQCIEGGGGYDVTRLAGRTQCSEGCGGQVSGGAGAGGGLGGGDGDARAAAPRSSQSPLSRRGPRGAGRQGPARGPGPGAEQDSDPRVLTRAQRGLETQPPPPTRAGFSGEGRPPPPRQMTLSLLPAADTRCLQDP